jgi:hypothetical protein
MAGQVCDEPVIRFFWPPVCTCTQNGCLVRILSVVSGPLDGGPSAGHEMHDEKNGCLDFSHFTFPPGLFHVVLVVGLRCLP